MADPVLMERALSLASHLDAARALENSPAFSLMDCITNSITQSGHSDCEAVSSQLLSSSGALHSYLPYVPQEGQAGHEAKQAVGHAVCEALVACVERYCRQPVPNGAHKVRKGWDAVSMQHMQTHDMALHLPCQAGAATCLLGHSFTHVPSCKQHTCVLNSFLALPALSSLHISAEAVSAVNHSGKESSALR